jgi:hypothetical protein
MNLGNLLTPWLMLAAVIIPLVYVEKWIHAHLYGVGWLVTNDKKGATALYYVLLFPGVLVHEFTQYLVAGALNVKIKRVIAWPQAQNDGTLRLDFVQIKNANRVQAAIIGAAPLFSGLALVWLISSRVLNLDNVVNAIGTGNLDTIGAALRDAASAPDFLLWLYVIFTISNAMLPTPADRQGWPLLIGAFVVVIGFLVLIGVGDVLMETFTGPVAHGVNRLTTAFATVLVAEVPGILTIGFVEEILEKTTRRKFEYSQSQAARRRTDRQPGSNLPLPPGTPLPSIYNLDLPIPSPSEVKALSARARRPVQPSTREQPALSPDTAVGPRPRPTFQGTAADTPQPGREPRPATEGTPGSARPESPFPRPSAPTLGDQPSTPGEERPPFRRPEGTPPVARPESPFPRPSTPTVGDQPSARGEERPPFRRPEGTPPVARPESPFPRPRSAPARANDAPDDLSGFRTQRRSDRPATDSDASSDRFARPQPARPGLPTPSRGDETAPGTLRRPSPFGERPLTSRPSPFAASAEDDEEEEEEDEGVTYEDFDNEDGVLDNVYGDDEEDDKDE